MLQELPAGELSKIGEQLEQLMGDSAWRVREAAVKTISCLSKEDLAKEDNQVGKVGKLFDMLEDEARPVRNCVVEALGVVLTKLEGGVLYTVLCCTRAVHCTVLYTLHIALCCALAISCSDTGCNTPQLQCSTTSESEYNVIPRVQCIPLSTM